MAWRLVGSSNLAVNCVVMDCDVRLCALAHQIAPASTCMSGVTCNGLELLAAIQGYLPWLGVVQAACYPRLLLRMTVICRATCTIRGYIAGEVCVHFWLLQRVCLVGNSLLWHHSVCMMCCMMRLWVLAIVCASAPEWAWAIAAACVAPALVLPLLCLLMCSIQGVIAASCRCVCCAC